ncbi:transcriptional repressor general negative regulator of transcription subunit 4 [Podila clonocystis]|nr:transcriptional repressor general negative regulator of transcription subunit 4 [Podila clonocystis]
MMSDDDDFDCPLCMEELDISDRNFRPCPCGYQICRFCWHHIKEDLNGRCPACRRIYSEETVEFTPISSDELVMIKNEKKAKEREKKEIEAMSRKHLSNMRVVQKSLVYVIGLPTKLANDEHTLRQHEYFGQYGKISKVVINRRNTPMPSAGALPNQASLGVYITYSRKEDAAKAIAAIDGSIWDGKILRASYGTTKYCTYYLRGLSCQNPGCMYLHEPGEDADSYTKEDLAVGKHHLQEHMGPFDPYSHKPSVLGRPPLSSQSSSSSLTPRPKPATVASYHSATSSLSDWPAPGERSNGNDDDKDEGSALPATASWAKIGSNPSTPILHSSSPLSRKLDPPPLRSKGSTASIITGIVVNNGKRKEVNYAKDGSVLDYSPTPAEALAIEAAAKQQLLLEQRQQQEQLRKMQEEQRKEQQKLEEEAELQAELLQQKLKKQRQLELEQQQIELQKLRQQQEMDAKLQKQREKEQQRREQLRRENLQKEKEKEARSLQERMEREEREEKERQDTIRKEREQKAAEEKAALLKARREKEEQELKEQLALKEQQEKERKLREVKERIEQERLEKERADQERVEQERAEQELVERERAEKERIEQERAEQDRVEKERAEKERKEQELQERAEEEARLAQIQAESAHATQSNLSLGSFSFNPDASLTTLPYSLGQPNTATTAGEGPPGFGLGNFAAYSGMPVTPSHYTGSFNPFSLDDEPLMRRPMAPPARSFLDDVDYSPASDRNRHVGPPIPGKPRQTSRFGFASDNEHGDSFGRESFPDPSNNMQSMQDGFRALFPNVNVSFGAQPGSLIQQQQQQQQHLQQQQQQQHHHHQQHQHQLHHQQLHQPQQQLHQQQYQHLQPHLNAPYRTSPLLHRQEPAPSGGLWGNAEKQENPAFQRGMGQLNMDPMLTTPSSRMSEYHQHLMMQQQQQPQQQQPVRGAPPGITRNPMAPSMVKSPPPGLESLLRNDGGWAGQQGQGQGQGHQQPHQYQNMQQSYQPMRPQQTRMNSWTGDAGLNQNNSGQGRAQDFFGAFLKAAAASPSNQQLSRMSAPPSTQNPMAFHDPAIMSARMSSSNATRASLVEALQKPPSNPNSLLAGLNGYRSEEGSKAALGILNSRANDASSDSGRGEDYDDQQRQRTDVRSAQGGLNPGSTSHQQPQPGSPQFESRPQPYSPLKPNVEAYPMAFGAGESPMMNGLTSAAARSAKVKSDLLMGLNGGIRPGQLPARESSESGQGSQSVNTKMNMMQQGPYSGAIPPGRPGPYGALNMNAYGGMSGVNSSMSMSMSMPGPASVPGPPPGLGMPLNSPMHMHNSNGIGGEPNGPYMNGPYMNGPSGMYNNNSNNNNNNNNNGNGNGNGNSTLTKNNNNSGKPMDVTSMMTALDFFGPPGSTLMSPNWSVANGMDGNRPDMNQVPARDPGLYNQSMGGDVQMNIGQNNNPSGASSDGASTPMNGGPATARSVEDLELQVINAKMETQMLENQLNAVIKRNRRKLYA